MITVVLILVGIVAILCLIKYYARKYYKDKLEDMDRGFEDKEKE